jgi:glycosyltransferase involved in cell wall biosynthesis
MLNKEQCRKDLGLPTDKKLILFGAAKISDVRKGFRYLNEALQILKDNFPELSKEIELVVFGKINKKTQKRFAFNTHTLKFISDPRMLVKLYNAADAFILPSLQDNLPNTVVESMCCGTPVVGFRIGGVPEMIEHMKTGYLAEVKNSLSLANGIYNMLLFSNDEQRQAVREAAVKKFSEDIVAQQYLSVYGKAISR